MQKIKRFFVLLLIVFGTICFVQAAGGYLAESLRSLDMDKDMQIDEKVVRQMVLRLEPREYYTVQIGSYTDTVGGQNTVDQLAQAGYRVFVTDGPPYQLWIGCTGQTLSIDALPQEIRTAGTDIFVQKQVLNRVQYRFPADASEEYQDASVLLASLDVVLKHSLQLFQDYQYEACSEENWNRMIAQIQNELQQIQTSSTAFLHQTEDEQMVGDMLNLLAAMDSYRESLQLIVDKKSTRMVLLAQSCLLELIAYYHTLIEQNSISSAA